MALGPAKLSWNALGAKADTSAELCYGQVMGAAGFIEPPAEQGKVCAHNCDVLGGEGRCKRLALLGRFNERTKLLVQCLPHNLILAKTFSLQLLSYFLDRRAFSGFRQLECAL